MSASLDNALIEAAKSGNHGEAESLLAAGADPKACKSLALRWGAESGHLEIVKLLLLLISDQKADGSYALRSAARNGHLDVVRILLPGSPRNDCSYALQIAT